MQDDVFDSDQPQFARTADSDAFGKLDDEIPAVRLDGDTRALLHRVATEHGMNVSEFVRNMVRVRVWGIEHCANVSASRLRRAMGNAGQTPGGAA